MCTRLAGLLFATVLFAGCAAQAPLETAEDWGPTYPVGIQVPSSGALYDAGALDLFADVRARRVGDVLTVQLVERTTGANNSATNSAKGANLGTSFPLFAGRPVTRNGVEILENEFSSDQSFTGQADSTQSNRLDGSIAVTVADVLPNGSLLVKGEKWITINQSKEFIRFSGIVRAIDIGPNNVISSTKVADARISYSGSGFLAGSNKPGWAARFFNSPWFPF